MEDKDFISSKELVEYIKDHLSMCIIGTQKMNSDLFHHNTSYAKMVSVIQNGLLSLQRLKDLQLIDIDDVTLRLADDVSSHINGKDGISLCKVGLTDLYQYEDVYWPFDPKEVDIQIEDIVTYRSTRHYGNEFIARDCISQDKFRSIDVRIFELINLYNWKKELVDSSIRYDILFRYNYLREMAISLKKKGFNIPLRETSYNQNNILDVNALAKSRILSLK